MAPAVGSELRSALVSAGVRLDALRVRTCVLMGSEAQYGGSLSV
jgi:hypothetical protein